MFALLSKQQGVWCGYNRVKEKARGEVEVRQEGEAE